MEEAIPKVIAEIVIRHRKKISDYFLDLFRPTKDIALFGCTGSGKTQFVETLKAAGARVEKVEDATLETRKTQFYIDKFKVMIHDTPGQPGFETKREEEITMVNSRNYEGVIFVVSYGYHEREDLVNVDQIKDNPQQFDDWLKKRRDIEIELVSNICKGIKFGADLKWVITLISKSDLWWNDRINVDEFYLTGPYSEAIKRILPKAKHTVIHYCSILDPFYGFFHSGTFGAKQSTKMQNHFKQTLLDVLGKIRK